MTFYARTRQPVRSPTARQSSRHARRLPLISRIRPADGHLSLGSRQRPLTVALLVILITCSTMTSACATTQQPIGRQMWVWSFTSQQALIDTAEQYSVTRLLVWVAPGFELRSSEVARLKVLRERATAAGIHMDALSGDPSWASSPDVASAWAGEVGRSGLFERIHLDIEPHARDDWTENRYNLQEGLLSAISGAARASGLPVDVDIPFWYSDIPTETGGSFDRAIMRLASSITIMAYRNQASMVLSVAATEMKNAAELGTPAWIGINTGSTGGDPPETSYLGQNGTVIKRDVQSITDQALQWNTFAGVALHDSSSLPTLE